MFLEMSRDENHGGQGWSFSTCAWSPTKKQGRGGSWPFWSKIQDVRIGDNILHLRGVIPHAAFVGYSTAITDGYETTARPPLAGEWDYADTFYRADLADYVAFPAPIYLNEVFLERRVELEEYFEINRARVTSKRNLFYVRQAGRLQCLNGAYLSDLDGDLFHALFGDVGISDGAGPSGVKTNVATGVHLGLLKTRIGQAALAKAVKQSYGHRCCFPACSVQDDRFLVASHIARWSDNEHLRGNVGNALCLCLMHDRAFELGLFTLDAEFSVFVNLPRVRQHKPLALPDLETQHGHPIKAGLVAPLLDALLEHWIRTGIDPT